MNMQDKEFDNLFRSKLEGLEAEPSASVWQGIDAGLRADKRKKLLLPLLSAAAGIIVLLTAGLWLYTRHAEVRGHQPGRGDIAKSSIQPKAPLTIAPHKTPQLAQVTTVKANPVKQLSTPQAVKKQLVAYAPQPAGRVAGQQPAVKQPAQEVIAALPQREKEITQPKQTDTVMLAANSVTVPEIKPAQAVVPDKPVASKIIAPPAKKHRIHSLGDMLNTVIAAVDKRKDKLIEFTDTDDDQSVVTGVNLGFIAVKKQN